jgi:hypothetical protein
MAARIRSMSALKASTIRAVASWTMRSKSGRNTSLWTFKRAAYSSSSTVPILSRGRRSPQEIARTYEVDEMKRVVEIRAVGIKDRDRVFIGGEEIKLS